MVGNLDSNPPGSSPRDMSYCTMHGDGTFPLTTGEHDTHDSLRACVMVMKGKGDRTSVS